MRPAAAPADIAKLGWSIADREGVRDVHSTTGDHDLLRHLTWTARPLQGLHLQTLWCCDWTYDEHGDGVLASPDGKGDTVDGLPGTFTIHGF